MENFRFEGYGVLDKERHPQCQTFEHLVPVGGTV